MYSFMNEDAAFERLKDLQREMENSRLIAGSTPSLGRVLRNVVENARWLGGLATRRAPSWRPMASRRDASTP